MEEKSGAQISQKAFIQSLLILLALMVFAGILTLVVPAGQYQRVEADGRETILPDSFAFTERPDYPIWRWFTAPLEVVTGPDGLTVIVIVVFILMVGVAFAIMDKSGILKAALARIVRRFAGQKYTLLLVISFFFMTLGAFFGIFEEVVPLVPLMIALAYSLGWDTLTGLGMSILATNMGFSAAIMNPFTVGVAQGIAELPAFSGAGYRIVIFLAMYALLAVFLTRHARKVEANPQASPVFAEEQATREKYAHFSADSIAHENKRTTPALAFLAVCVALIFAVLIVAPFVPAISDFALPIVGLLFLAAGVGSGLIAGVGRDAWKAAGEGLGGIAPAIPLILMAASVKFIIASGGILDTILHSAANAFLGASPIAAAILIFVLTLGIEFFVSSGSAKAFLLIPILVPLADLVGVTRQTAVLAYVFGDGFSNLAYPTSAVLLICLSLTAVAYPKWLRWVLGLWLWVILASLVFLGIAVMMNYGPF
ncbi:MAG: AbgT family transporter [Chloroflexi bacterium]|nr:AbgT family transporter [Chloroflexota bacterium]MCA2001091.1 AbgT family transporter [Chloroflexota bacterium]